jgi:serine/threonine-protein kinase RsbW
MVELPNVRLNLSNKPENVLLVREALSGLAETIKLDGSDLNDVRTAVTEACNNVVLHAYEGAEGPMEVDIYAPRRALSVVVRDRGVGIQPPSPPPRAAFAGGAVGGIGLPVIQALVHRVEFAQAPAGGTEVRMEFAAPLTHACETPDGDGLQPPVLAQTELLDTTTGIAIAIAPTRLARTVLPRLLSVLAARAHFSTDRISDAQIVADTLVAHTPGTIDGSHLGIAVSVEPRKLELRIGPLLAGSAQQLLVDSTVDGLGPVIETLIDDHRVAISGSAEMLALELIDRRR